MRIPRGRFGRDRDNQGNTVGAVIHDNVHRREPVLNTVAKRVHGIAEMARTRPAINPRIDAAQEFARAAVLNTNFHMAQDKSRSMEWLQQGWRSLARRRLG